MSYDGNRRYDLASGLKAARHNTGLSAARAATLISAAGIRCTRGTLLAWERGYGATSREPFASDLSSIAEVYGCCVGDFFQQAAVGAIDGQHATRSVAG